ncbi:MAG TPA: hypothetical protein VG010_07105 [Solirubrobacteraceae bacterium]|nr:hypothetical protein [Solirubrobacteraceae bacterium]
MNEPRPRNEAELIELIRSSDVRAPDALHRQVESLIADASRARRRPFLGGALSAGGAPIARRLAAATLLVAAIAAGVAIGLSGGGGSGALSLRQATALTLGQSSGPAPAQSASNSVALVASVQGVRFPYWGALGWRSTGQRTDQVAGRAVTTVFYANAAGQRIGYSIFAGTPAPSVHGGAVNWRAGNSYRLFAGQGTGTVVWLRNGHLCVLSGRGVAGPTLLSLANWGDSATPA